MSTSTSSLPSPPSPPPPSSSPSSPSPSPHARGSMTASASIITADTAAPSVQDLSLLVTDLLHRQTVLEDTLESMGVPVRTEEELENEHSSVERYARQLIQNFDVRLTRRFGWKLALVIVGLVLVLDAIFITVFSIFSANNCYHTTQLIDGNTDSSFAQILKQSEGGRKTLCVSERLQFISKQMSPDDLAVMDLQAKLGIGVDQNTQGDAEGPYWSMAKRNIRNQAETVRWYYNGTNTGSPSLWLFDTTFPENYPCFFPQFSCDDFGDDKACPGSLSRIHDACQRGVLQQDGTFDSTAFNAQDDEYFERSREYWAVASQCTGLVSVTYQQCPNLELVLGSALSFVTSLQATVLFIVVLLTYWLAKVPKQDDDQDDDDDDDNTTTDNKSGRLEAFQKALKKTQKTLATF